MFGADFGLVASKMLGGPKDKGTSPEPDRVLDIMALIGTMILWMYWPSFVGTNETDILVNDQKI